LIRRVGLQSQKAWKKWILILGRSTWVEISGKKKGKERLTGREGRVGNETLPGRKRNLEILEKTKDRQ